MKAIVLKAYGGLDNLEYAELPQPIAGKGAVLVRVQVCSINPLDLKISSGSLSPVSGLRFPKALGSDFSGTVLEVGPGVAGFRVGDEVYGRAATMFGRQGALAELVAVPQNNLRLRPAHLNPEAAACLPVAGTTALSGLLQCGPLARKKVIVAGASGGVGHLAVQMAKALGARVVGTASGSKESFVRGLGVDEFVDYRTTAPEQMEAADVFFDAFGSTPYAGAARALVVGGSFVTTLPNMSLVLRKFLLAKIRFANVKATPPVFQELESLVAQGKLRVHVAQSFSLADGVSALQLLEKGGTAGKIVVRVGT